MVGGLHPPAPKTPGKPSTPPVEAGRPVKSAARGRQSPVEKYFKTLSFSIYINSYINMYVYM